MQFLGLSCQLYTIKHVESFYALEMVDTANFPITHKDVKDGGILKLALCLEAAKYEFINNYS
ncbi:hypothetical protein BCV72DRAFT_321824 [Rhizopus microsporus var. microsporus]|uniref:Uncharacterized protein n=1 Tax=Rhizopus microsporus var. microsporus TaxID=86635 RepID=A0A1X0RI13_RHIZD|nr:hypothetical protein BCV72DRAFT_321824 [Rhizopus microsporus var. microsporus]